MVFIVALPATFIYLSRKADIGAFIVKKAFTKVPAKYLDFAEIFIRPANKFAGTLSDQKSCH